MARKILIWIFILMASLFMVGSLRAATYTVDDDGPADFSTIQAAINAASSGDIIYVFPGVYKEQVIMKDGVNLFGAGPDVTVIDGGGVYDQVVTFSGSTGTIISGFKITGSSSYPLWTTSGILCSSGPLIIQNNIITENYGGITVGQAGTPTIINNTIVKNKTAGICMGCPPTSQTIMNNIIVGNDTGIWYYCNPSSGNISYNDVWGNDTNYFDNSAPGSFVPQPGTGEISQDPLFVDNIDYYLAEGSPCIDTGAPGPEYNDPDGTRNDMGAYGGPGAIGGRSSFKGSGFIFTSIGKIPTSEITQDPANPSHGLANVSDKVHEDFKIPKYTDSPFGGNLWIHGLFGDKDDVDYYQILVGKWTNGTAPDPDDFVCLNDPLTKVKYIINPDGTVYHQYVNLGPKTINSTDNLYQLTREGYWAHIDLRIIWNTRLWENGKYTLIYKAYRWDPISEKLKQVFPDPNELDHITIIVDNSPVTATIHNVKYDSGEEIPECGIINLSSDTENLRFTITAWHPNGYLKNYILDVLYGKNRYGGVIKSEHYDGTSPPYWYGVEEQEFQSKDAEPGALEPWQTCGYQFRLRVWSRTTDGYHYIIWGEFNDHYYINIGPHNLCKGDFDHDGDVDGADLAIFASEFGRTDCLP